MRPVRLSDILFDRYQTPPARLPGQSRPAHIVELDSLRGIAALVVVLDHFTRFWLETNHPAILEHLPLGKLSPLLFLINGVASVTMFFVLSGFVLTLPVLGGKAQTYPVYAVRRICRIYLPYLAALSLALLGCRLFYGRPLFGDEFHLVWQAAPDVRTVAQHIAFLGVFNSYAYDPPIWSLVHEMRISLVFPALCWIALRLRAAVAFALVLAFPLLAGVLHAFWPTPGAGTHASGTASVAWSHTLAFCGLFLLGSLLARYRESIVSTLGRLPAFAWWLLVTPAVGLFEYPTYFRRLGVGGSLVSGVGAAILLCLALVPGSLFSRILHLRSPRYLGRISYSLYLLHLPILLVLAITTYGKLPYVLLIFPFLLLSFAAASLFYRVIEQPAMQLGRVAGARLNSRSNSLTPI